MEVGTLGGISFYVKFNKKPKMLSFSDVSLSSSAQWEEHARNGKKAYLEFIAPGLETISFEIYASAQFGVNPLKTKKKLDSYRKAGTPNYFVMGGKKIGDARWVITDLQSTVNVIWKNGRPMAIRFSVTMKEYANPLKKKKASTKKKTTKATTTGKNKTTKTKKTSYYTYTTKKNDTLWKIAKKYYGNGKKYTKIYNANKKASKGFNKISDPNKIKAGWVIKIPK